jgi:outer membrane receptor protein involved in Fe transport
VWGKNLLDEEYSNYGVSSTVGELYSPAEPRMYGVAVSMSW